LQTHASAAVVEDGGESVREQHGRQGDALGLVLFQVQGKSQEWDQYDASAESEEA
jgi:hypothetical protein